MNWDDARVFLAVCRESTLRGAARVLGVDQATVGRRITALETSLNTRAAPSLSSTNLEAAQTRSETP